MNPPKTRPHGGKRPGAGRPPDWLKRKCADAIDKNKLIDFLVSVATGEETQPMLVKVDHNHSEIEQVPASIHDRLRAVEMLLDRGYGKPAQAVEHSGSMVLKLLAQEANEGR